MCGVNVDTSYMKGEKKYYKAERSLEEQKYREDLLERSDAKTKRVLRFLSMPDLSRMPESPLAELVARIKRIERFSNFDEVEVPEVVRADVSFDLFNFPPDHPARKSTDTYFIDKDHILRTHTTIMWYYWLREKEVREKILKKMSVGALCWGKVYRKDEIDCNHMPVFHQLDGWYLVPKTEETIGVEDLKNVLTEIACAMFGEKVVYRFNPDEFPYTDPSVEMEVEVNGRWVEVLGAGVVRPVVLKNLGVDPEVYNGWAFGFGLERLAIISMALPDIRLLWSDDPRIKKQLHLGRVFVPVSKYPPITRDVSFVASGDFVPNNYFDLIRDIGGDMVEEVKLLDKYENAEKFGAGRMSWTWRIVWRRSDRTLLSSEIDPLQEKIYQETAKQFHAELR